MQAVIQRADLARVLSAVARVVQPRGTVPILRNVILTADGDRLSARGTDLDIEISTSAEATVAKSGTVCVDAHSIADIVKRMDGEQVTLALESGVLTVKSGRSRFKLPTIPANDMPTLSAGDFTHEFAFDLAALLAPVLFAVGDSQARYTLTGAYLHTFEGRLRAVGCDGNCLSSYDVEMPLGASDMPGIIIPQRVADLVAAHKGDCTVRVSRNIVSISSGPTTFNAKLIEGTYIDYMRSMPADIGASVQMVKADLLSAVDRALIITSTLPGKAVRMHVAADTIKIVASDSDGRDSSEDVPGALTGEPFKVAFGSDYLRGLLQAAPGPVVRIDLDTSGTRSVFRSVSDNHFMGALGAYRVAA